MAEARIIKEITKKDLAKIAEIFIESISGQEHNRILNETISTIAQLMTDSHSRIAAESGGMIADFYQKQLLFYMQMQEVSKPKGLIDYLKPKKAELDPRELARQDMQNLVNSLTGTNPITRLQEIQLYNALLSNLTNALQRNLINPPNRQNLEKFAEIIKKELNNKDHG